MTHQINPACIKLERLVGGSRPCYDEVQKLDNVFGMARMLKLGLGSGRLWRKPVVGDNNRKAGCCGQFPGKNGVVALVLA